MARCEVVTWLHTYRGPKFLTIGFAALNLDEVVKEPSIWTGDRLKVKDGVVEGESDRVERPHHVCIRYIRTGNCSHLYKIQKCMGQKTISVTSIF